MLADKHLYELLQNGVHIAIDQSSYHVHKMLEELEKTTVADLPEAWEITFEYLECLKALDMMRERCRAVLLTRFRSQLDAQHERELIEDWKGAFDE